jgi:hypothetical protein
MIRRLLALCPVLLLAACASQAPATRPRTPGAVPPAPPRGEPRDFLNMTAATLRRQLGEPAFTRKDGVTQMWRYDGAACRAFFFLYDAKGQMAVRHVETLPHGASGAADMGCLTALKRAPAKTS